MQINFINNAIEIFQALQVNQSLLSHYLPEVSEKFVFLINMIDM